MLVIRLEDQGVLETPVRKLVTTSADITYLSELGQSWLNKEKETIMVSSDVGQTELLTFANAQVLKKVFDAVWYWTSCVCWAKWASCFTGHTKYTGKTITISYEDGTTVSYGMLDSLAQLPYTTVQANDLIGMKQAGQLYLSIEKVILTII